MFVILIPFITYDCLVDHQFIVRCIKLYFSLRSIITIKITVNRHIWFSVILGQFSVSKISKLEQVRRDKLICSRVTIWLHPAVATIRHKS